MFLHSMYGWFHWFQAGGWHGVHHAYGHIHHFRHLTRQRYYSPLRWHIVCIKAPCP